MTLNVAKAGKRALAVVGWSISNSYIAPSAVWIDVAKQEAGMTARRMDESTSSGDTPVYFRVLYVNV